MPSIAQFEPRFGEEEATALAEYMRTGGWCTEFRQTRAFEERICAFTGASHCAAVNNGTVAITLALLGIGVEPGDEIIVPDFTMIATANAARLIGAKPVFVDIERDTLCIDVEQALGRIGPRTKAVIHVSINGRCNGIDALAAGCRARGVTLMEDAAQSFGSFRDGRHLGTIGDVGTFSFSPAKIITTGQGGAVVTSCPGLGERIRRMKDFGRAGGGADIHDMMGYNFKFTDLQAVVGLAQLDRLDDRIECKRAIFGRYREALADVEQVEFIETDLAQTTPWFVDVLVPDPSALREHLASHEIGSRLFYPPIHSQEAYGLGGSFPVTESIAARGLWLPSSAHLAEADVDRVCDRVRDFFAGGGPR